MRHSIERLRNEDDGFVLVFIALVMAVLMGLAALSLDLSLGMNKRREAQNAVDNAVLEAAWASCHGGDATAAANQSVTRNGFSPSDLTLVAAGSNRYEGTVDTSIGTFFGRVIGFSTIDISTSAAASCDSGGGGGRAIFAIGNNCSKQVDISGSNNRVSGGVHSNGNLYIGSQGNNFNYDPTPPGPGPDPVTYVTTVNDYDDDNTFEGDDPTQVGFMPDPDVNLFDVEDWDGDGIGDNAIVAAAKAAGLFYTTGGGNDLIVNGPGVYYNPRGKILLNSTPGSVLDVTLIAGDGTDNDQIIDISASGSGSNIILRPWRGVGGTLENDLFAFGNYRPPSGGFDDDRCAKEVVKIAGQNVQWEGIIFGPGGLIELSGSDSTTLKGSLIGHSVRLNGSDITIIGDEFGGTGESFVRLEE